ncbi:ACYL-ACTIVATING ENZYME [Salix viminalis]|uniref:ACYL-ACTIVATING ENZYME n=1 Tax=Salix viminalis TaxID=40686 RepID=A0A9Q0PA60_SALVM|nr:ACYL-ACTIVATING ENZYME [Salix viminalis]
MPMVLPRPLGQHLYVKDLDTMASVPRDGKTMGEIFLRGSSIMKGYFKDPEATSKAFRNGWFATGDVGVVHTYLHG